MKAPFSLSPVFALLLVLFGSNGLRAQTILSESFNTNSIPEGWTVEDGGSGACRWMIHAPSTAIPMLGSNYLFVNSDSSGASTVGNETITSPLVPLNAGSQVFLSFQHFFRKRNNRQDTGRVEIFFNGNWVKALEFVTSKGNINNPASELLNVSAWAGPEFRVRFQYKSLRAWYWAIDNIRIFSPPAADLGVLELSNLNPCGIALPFPVSLKIKNFGSQKQSGFPLYYQVGNQTAVQGIFQDSIAAGDTAVYTFSTPFNTSASGSLSFRAWSSLEGDSLPANDTLNTILNLPPGSFATVGFTGFTGANLNQIHPGWQEATGSFPQTGSSTWNSPNAQQIQALGSETAKINLYTTGTNAWIISPVFRAASAQNLRFKMALTKWNAIEADVMGSDDSLKVMLTRDCGQSWELLRAFTAADPIANVLQDYSISLSSYEGEVLRIAFRASDGSTDNPNDYDIHLDDIRLGIISPNDMSLSDILLTSGPCGQPSAFPVKVKVRNTGTLPQNSLPLNYQIQGEGLVSQVFPVSLEAGADTILEFSSLASVPNPGNYFISAWVSLPADANPGDDSVLAVPFTRVNQGFVLQNFTAYDGITLTSGWEEASGDAGSLVEGSAWNSAVTGQVSGLGSETARINLYTSARKEWLISPAFNPVTGKALRFKLALTNWGSMEVDSMGSDDSLIVKITTDCGQTWQNLKSYTRANQLSNQFITEAISLTAYVGQTLRLAFYATDGSIDDNPDYDLHIDDVELINLSPNDVGVTALLLPSLECGLPSVLPVKVKVGNLGTQVQSGFTIAYSVNGANTQSEPFTSTLNPGQEQEFQFAVPASFAVAGAYVIKAWTSLAGDQDLSNDSLSSPVLNTTPENLSPVNFNNFDGSNLSTVFPGWSEKAGDTPSGNSSLWNFSNANQTTSLGSITARVGLSGNTRREWIISPGFRPAAQSELRFSLAVTDRNFSVSDFMGSDDSLKIMVSSNCGQTWTLLRAITAQNGLGNTLTAFTADLSGFAGQDCQIAFMATDGNIDNLEDYEIHLDNIQTGPLTTGIQSGLGSLSSIRVYPNPATAGIIRLELPGREQNPRFFSISGKEFFPPRLQADELLFNTADMPAGYYLIRSGSFAASFLLR